MLASEASRYFEAAHLLRNIPPSWTIQGNTYREPSFYPYRI